MRVKNMMRKKDCLDCLFQEINILTECRHANIVKILDASFDGTLEKRRSISDTQPKSSYTTTHQLETDFAELKSSPVKDGSTAQRSKAEEIKEILDKNKRKGDKSFSNSQGRLSQIFKAQKSGDEDEQPYTIEKRKTDLVYYVMKLAEFGELYSFLEYAETPFSERMTRYILD